MTAAAVLARARAAGVRLRLRPDGGLRVEADAPPSDALLGELREWRDDIVRLLAAQDRRSGPGASFPDVPADEHEMRPPSWSDPAPPPRGAWCSCCGRSNPKAGGRWWRPRNPRTDGLGLAQGWRCMTCHPPPFGSEVEERRT
jgi:hypothetical protein